MGAAATAERDRNDPPLEWQTFKRFDRENVQVEVTMAVGRSGRRMLSFALGSVSPKTGKTSKHVKEIDLSVACALMEEARQWAEAFRYEEDQARDTQRRR